MLINLDITRKLYNSYSTTKTNNSLLSLYYDITNDYSHIDNIRKQYNNVIMSNYLNETVIKSSFIKRELSRKSPRLNVGVFELNTLNSRADLAFINGSSFVYEIKTEYDDFSRLESQLNDYMKLFEHLYVIVPKADVTSVKSLISTFVGVISYSTNRLGNVTFNYERVATYNSNVDSYSQLSTLTKKELLALNKTPNDYSINKETLINELISNLKKEKINKLYKNSIKNKYIDRWQFLHKNLSNIYELDYQWFFKNNLDFSLIYR